MYSYNEIQTVHLEVTTKCNAQCPMCLRSVFGGKVNPQLPIVELSLKDIQKIFPKDFISQLKKMYMCGNYGDPMVGKDTLEIFQYFKNVNPSINLSMFTNGSGKKVSWWQDLAKVTSSVHFSIDGLEDTNHIYRRGTRFNRIMESVKAYIGSGGHAIWDFIVFKHNEHQVDEAQELSETLGFKKFVVKKTGRFFHNLDSKGKDKQEVRNAKGELEYYLEKPKKSEYQNKALQKEAELSSSYGSLSNYFEKSKILCKVAAEKSIYVTAEGLVYPCCWTAHQMYPWYLKEKSSQIWDFIENKDTTTISAKEKSLQEVLEGGFFSKIQKSWELKSVESGRLKVCSRICSSKFDQFRAQF